MRFKNLLLPEIFEPILRPCAWVVLSLFLISSCEIWPQRSMREVIVVDKGLIIGLIPMWMQADTADTEHGVNGGRWLFDDWLLRRQRINQWIGYLLSHSAVVSLSQSCCSLVVPALSYGKTFPCQPSSFI